MASGETNLKDTSEEVGMGTMVLSVDSTKRSPSIILKTNGITIVSNDPAVGIDVDDGGVTIQGKVSMSASGKSITKGIYSENNKSAKPFTYTETIQVESILKEALYNVLGGQGIDVSSFAKSGVVPIITDVSAGPLPHVHTIKAFKHVHRVEPAYLYRVSPILTCLKGPVQSLREFLSL